MTDPKPLAPPVTFLPPLPDPRGDGPEHGTVAGRIERERRVLREGEALRARRLRDMLERMKWREEL